MCGFVGFIDPSGLPHDAPAIVDAMSARIAHRGPDDAGVWTDLNAGVALGFRRLAIVDLTEAGRQPMASSDGRYVLVFNGEVYNHLELRADLDGPWRGHSDTETLLAALSRWGIGTTLQRSVGMFAFAVWDRQERTLTIARDRMGEKPLYYGVAGGRLRFGSELKALLADPSFRPDVDRGALGAYLRHGYVPGPHSIYAGVHKLPPGTYLRIPSAALTPGAALDEPTPYWSLEEVAAHGRARPFEGNDEEAVGMLDDLVHRAVRLQRVADVPLGAFLSGGVDSSTIVAIMQAQSTTPVRTFTIGFDEAPYDESEHARAVAEHLGTDHTELRVRASDALAVIDRLPNLFDEPFGDASAIPTFLVSELARRHVTVSLSGDGGDELFAGYGRYHHVHGIWTRARRVPPPLRNAARFALAGAQPWVSHTVQRGPAAALVFAERLRTARSAASPTIAAAYRENMSLWRQPSLAIATQHTEATSALSWPVSNAVGDGFAHMMYTDALTYLPDDILTKVDRTAMATSLETRVPLLDHRVVEYAWRLPAHLKVRDGEAKWVLKKVLERYVPRKLTERPKMGFGVPIDEWLRGPLRPWAEDLLDADRLRREGFLDPNTIRLRWADHLSGRRDWQYLLWPVLVFQAWLANRDLAD